MTTLIPALEDELRQAAARTVPAVAGGAVPRWREPRPRRRAMPAAALAAATLSIAGTAYAARGLWMPELGADSYGHAVATGDPVPASESSVLGVLRRAQTDADRGPAARAILRAASPALGQVRTNDVRRLGTLPDGRVAVLVPARVPDGFDPTLPHITRDQLLLGIYDPSTDRVSGFLSDSALGMRAGNLMWPVSARLSATQQQRADAFLEAEVAAGRLRKSNVPPYYGVMSVRQSSRYLAAVGISPRDPVTYIGVVPDGVATVEVDGGEGVPVHENFFVAQSTVGSKQPTRWLDASGQVVPFASTLGAGAK